MAALEARSWGPGCVAGRRRFNALTGCHTTAAAQAAGTLRPRTDARAWASARGALTLGPALDWGPPTL